VFPSLDTVEIAYLAAMLGADGRGPRQAGRAEPGGAAGYARVARSGERSQRRNLRPIVVLLLGLAVGTQIEGEPMVHAARVMVEEIGTD
jgi:hypothetical protein